MNSNNINEPVGDNVMTCSDMVMRVFTNIEQRDLEKGNKVIGAWRRTVESIRPNGKNISAHSRVIDLKNNILLIEADHPGWIQLLQMHQKYVMTGLKRLVPDLNIQSLAFRLSGSAAHLTDAAAAESQRQMQTRERERLQRKFEKEEEALSEHGFGYAKAQKSGNQKTENAKELPAELKTLFDRFKSEMKNEEKA